MVSQKKICLLIASRLPGIEKDKITNWLKQTAELSIIADIEPVLVFDQDSADITPAVWLKLAQTIHQRINRYDGFVVLHGADNLLYSSSALSFLLQNITKPIIFMGSNMAEKTHRESGIRANLINAIQVATFNFSEICLMFGNRLLRANQSIWSTTGSLNVFLAPPSGVLGRIDFSIRIVDKLVAKNKGRTKLFNQLNSQIEIIDIYPNLDSKLLTERLVAKKGLIINAGDYYKLPEFLLTLIEKKVKDIPIVVWSQKITTSVLAPSNIIMVNNITWPSTTTKFMWALTQTKNIKKLKELMAKNIAGELNN